MAVGDREVGGVVRHGVPLVGLDAKADIGEREVGRGLLGDGNALNRVALLPILGTLQGVVQLQVRIQWIVLRSRNLLGHGIIERCRHLHLFGEELAEFYVGGDGIRLIVIGGTLHNTFLQTAEALRHHLSCGIDHTDVRQLHVERSRSCPAALVDRLHQAKLVDPHLTGLGASHQVAYTNHHGLHLAQRRITQHADLVIGMVGVIVGIQHREAGRSHGACLVAGFLQTGEDAQIDIEHIGQRPYGTTVVHIIFIIVVAVGSQLQGYHVLIVVVGVVATQTNEDGQLVILQRGDVVYQMVGMYKHLDMLILTQVECRIAIHRLGLALRQVLDHHGQRLFVGFGELWLGGVGHSGNARR